MDVMVSPRNNHRLRNRGKTITNRHPKTKQILTRNHKSAKNSGKSSIFRNREIVIKTRKNHRRSLNNNSQGFRDPVIGEFTRQVYDAICTQLKGNNPMHIPEDNVLNILNQLHVYPSKSQVSKMLQYAKRCNRNGAGHNYLTFGEFCVLIREMQSQKNNSLQQARKLSIANNKSSIKYQVFLGGSCNPTTWRADTAIPELQKLGISFYNPQVTMWAPELVEQEYDAKQAAQLLLFVMDSQTRSTVGMIEVAYLVASGRCVVVVAQPFSKGQSIMGEVVSDEEYYDLVAGLSSLLHLVKSKGVKIHEDLRSALQCTAKFFEGTTSPEEQIAHKISKLEEEYKSCKGSIDVGKILDIHERLTNRRPDPGKVQNYLKKVETNGTITFDQFLALMAEIDGCDMCTMRMNSTNNNSCEPTNPRWTCNGGEPSVNETALKSAPYRYDVFLGGSVRTGIKWRTEFSPLFDNHNVSYYNPTIRENGVNSEERESMEDRMVQEWKLAMDSSRIKLFVITNDTRSLTTLVLAAHCLAKPENVVLCIQHLPDGCVINNETLTKNAIKDYNRARVYLADLAKRKQVKVFSNVKDAVQEAIEKSKNR